MLGTLPAGAEPTSTSAITKLQADLRMLGFYRGPLDGKSDPRLDEAVKTFEYGVGLPADGKCDERCVAAIKKALGLDDPALPPDAAPVSSPTLTQLQADLRKLGFYRGSLDGKSEPRLDEAVKTFEHSVGLPADGKCTERCQLAIVKALTGA